MEISFGYKSKLKDITDLCAYTGERIERKRRSVEHILPKSLGGPSNESNYLMTDIKINNKRGNMLFSKWLRIVPETIDHIQNYLNELRGTKINGHDYVEEVKKTLNKEARGVVTFKGNKLNIEA